MKLKGRVWKFRDNISTDDIAPGRYFHLRSNLPELAKHALEGENAVFASRVKAGDFIAAGENFGLGSSREHAPAILKLLGVRAILAPSFARIFFRNAINLGIPLLITETASIDEGDELEVNLTTGEIKNLTRDSVLKTQKIPPFMLEILKAGGLISYLAKNKDFKLPG